MFLVNFPIHRDGTQAAGNFLRLLGMLYYVWLRATKFGVTAHHKEGGF